MASPNFAKKNPFMGMSIAEMKKYYDTKVRGKNLKAKDLKVIADQMQAAKKSAPKAKAAPKASPKPKQASKETAAKRFYSSSSQGSVQKNQDKAKSNFFRSSSGTRGKLRPSNPASPTVTRKGSKTGAAVDPRERSLRKNLADARRKRNRNKLKPANRRGRRM